MNDREEPALLTLILFPFRLLIALADLAALLWMLMLFGGLFGLIGLFLWALLFHRP